MPTSDWSIPTGKAITGATYIKDTDNNIAATIEDLVDWCNNANGTYTDWTLTGLRTDFLDINTAQTITAVKTVDTLGAIDFTGGELRVGGVAVTSTAAELNILDGVTSTTAELNILDGVTSTTAELNILDGVTSTAAELNILDGVTSTTAELNILDGVTATATELNILDGVTATSTDLNKTSSLDSGTWTPVATNTSNISSSTTYLSTYMRVGDVVHCFLKIRMASTLDGIDTSLSIDIPIASTLSNDFELTGALAHGGALDMYPAQVKADTVNNKAKITYYSKYSSTPMDFFGTFSYRVI